VRIYFIASSGELLRSTTLLPNYAVACHTESLDAIYTGIEMTSGRFASSCSLRSARRFPP
jgi:hypothetical protein